MTKLPQFSRALLHPRYWATWFGLGLLYLIVQLPYPLLCRLGCGLGRFSMRFMKRRVFIVRRNLELCFPDMPAELREKRVVENFESVGMGLIETGMAWFWPTQRINRWCHYEGVETVERIQQSGQGVLLIGIHFLTLELGARIFGIKTPGIGVYRPNDNKVLDWVQTRGRMRSNKSMLDRKDLKGMIRALKEGEILWYAPDHDYGPRGSTFVPFFAVEQAATTTGTYTLAKLSGAAIVPFVPRRLPNAKGYELKIMDTIVSPPLNSPEETAGWMNNIVEECINIAPEQYMWLHRRFKTRPEGVADRYQ